MIEHALSYAARGWRVFPIHYSLDGASCAVCRKPTGKGKDRCGLKTPIEQLAPNGCDSATTSVATLQMWWGMHPHANIGVATGPGSDLFVVDLDDHVGGSDTWEGLTSEHGADECGLVVLTGGGGVHLYYKHVEGGRNSASRLFGPGVDSRADHGYVVAPPSLHCSGSRYAWEEPGTPGPAPEWVQTIARSTPRHRPTATPVEGLPRRTVERQDLVDFATFKAPYQDAAAATKATNLMLEGKAWAEQGSRHDTLLVWSGAFRSWFVTRHRALADFYDAQSFQPTIDAVVRAGSGVIVDLATFSEFHENLRAADTDREARHLAEHDLRQAARAAAEDALTSDLADFERACALIKADPSEGGESPVQAAEGTIARGFGDGRTTPYTTDELAVMQPLAKRWIIHTNAGYFIRKLHDYVGPVSRDQLRVKARDVLAPAEVAGVHVRQPSQDVGVLAQLKSPDVLTDEYGQVPDSTEYSYTTSFSCMKGSTFIMKAAPLRQLPPEHNPQIEQWLRLLAGAQYEPFMDWLATVHLLERATCAVCIKGYPGVGKDLLATSLGRVWSEHTAYTEFEHATSPFNPTLRDTPLVFANEGVRVGGIGQNAVDTFKSMVTGASRSVADKNVRATQLRGHVRVLLATNSEGGIKFSNRAPTADDIRALDDRILLLSTQKDARDYLESLDHSVKEQWCAGDGFARHVSWLRTNRPVNANSGQRFLVQGQGGIGDMLAAVSSSGKPIITAILNALIGRPTRDERVARVQDGQVWISSANLHSSWATFGDGKPRPEALGEALDTLCVPGSSKPHKVEGELCRMRQVRLETLEYAASSQGCLDELRGYTGGVT